MTTHDPIDIYSEESAQADLATRRRNARDTEEGDLKWLMSSKRGRRIVWRQLEAAGVFRSSFNTNAMAMAFAEGNRNIGLRLLGQIHSVCPEHYTTMMKESNEHRDNNTDDGQRRNNQ